MRRTALLVMLAGAMTLASCATPEPQPRPPRYPAREDIFAPPDFDGGARLEAIDHNALLPERVRVHPLTRLADNPAGVLRLVCHIELQDKFDHGVKGLGQVRIELYPPDGLPPTASRERLFWSVDLADPEENALHFDNLVTQTYQLDLYGLPDWATDWVTGKLTAPWLRLRVLFRTIDSDGREIILEDAMRIHR